MRSKLTTLPALIGLAAPLCAQRIQSPDAPWRTIQTAHYRIHYPARGDFEPFAMEVASKIEGIHTRVIEWVGYESPRMVDVLIRDPRLEGNGMALPLLKHPFVELWMTPPESASELSHFTTWPELLVTHELTHIHHLLRPKSNPRFLDKLLGLPVGPLTLKAPRWVIEGYATVIEGRVTGSGRPHSGYRAALLRQWAREGKLPDYGALNGFPGFRGGNLAYLVGSAYLEWLERRELACSGRPGRALPGLSVGEHEGGRRGSEATGRSPLVHVGEKDVLKKLWRKLAVARSFDTVFLGTFGFSARDGYDRFRAELSADALAFERRMVDQQLVREGEVFTKVDGEVTDLSVSPDGTRLLARVVTPSFKGLRVWALNESAKSKPKTRLPKISDPDVAPLIPQKEATWELGRSAGLVPEEPSWAPVSAPFSNSMSGTGASPTADLIQFSVREPNDEGVLVRRPKGWLPGTSRVETHPLQAMAQPEPKPLFRALEADGLLGIWSLPDEASGLLKRPVVRTASAAWLPAPTPDGKTLFYVQLSATGCEIRSLDLTLPPLAEAPIPWGGSFFAMDGVKPKADEASQLPPPASPLPAHDYAVGETLWSGQRSGLTLSPSGKSYELGYGGSDLLGRFSWQVLGAMGNASGPRGGTAGFTYRGWRWTPSLQVFSTLERPSRQQTVPEQGFDRQRAGGELAFGYESRNTTPAFFKPTLAFERIQFKEGSGPGISRRLLGVNFGISRLWNRGETWGVRLSLQAKGGVGQTAGHSWNSHRALAQVKFSTPLIPLTLKAESGAVLGDPTSLDRLHLGGLTTSLVPASLAWNRVEQAALPSYLGKGDRLRRWRIEAGSGLRAYLEATAIWDHTQDRSAFTKVAGVEFDLMQLIGNRDPVERLVGRMTFVAGIHQVLKDPSPGRSMQGRTVNTLSLVLRP